MRALYEPEVHLVAIYLDAHKLSVDAVDFPHATVLVDEDDLPETIELYNRNTDIVEPLGQIAERFGLDLEELLAAARAALAVPDREVTIGVERATVSGG